MESRTPVDKSEVYRFMVKMGRHNLGYFCGLLDAYTHLAVPRTRDPRAALIEVQASPYFIEDVRSLLLALNEEFPVEIIKEGQWDEEKGAYEGEGG